MSAPRTFREVNFLVKELRWGIGACIAGLIVVLIAIAGASFALYHVAYQENGKVDSKVSDLQSSLKEVGERLNRMDTSIRRMEQALALIEVKISSALTPSPISLEPEEISTLRYFFKLTRRAAPPKFKLEDKVPDDELRPVPGIIVEKLVPKLKGTKYLVDQNGSLVVTAGADNTTVLIVEPA